MSKAMQNLVAGNTGTAPVKAKKEEALIGKKEYKNIYLDTKAISLLSKLTFTEKAENDKYTIGDTVYDALKLLAKEKGVAHEEALKS